MKSSVGAKVILTSSEVASEGSQLRSILERSGATVMQATPATWQVLLAAGWQGSPGLKMLCGGEALSQELAHQLLERGASRWNLYRPTEVTIWSMVSQIRSKAAPISIGTPIANTQIYLVDAHLNPVPVGPGTTHKTLYTENLQVTAQQLRACLDGAQAPLEQPVEKVNQKVSNKG